MLENLLFTKFFRAYSQLAYRAMTNMLPNIEWKNPSWAPQNNMLFFNIINHSAQEKEFVKVRKGEAINNLLRVLQ